MGSASSATIWPNAATAASGRPAARSASPSSCHRPWAHQGSAWAASATARARSSLGIPRTRERHHSTSSGELASPRLPSTSSMAAWRRPAFSSRSSAAMRAAAGNIPTDTSSARASARSGSSFRHSVARRSRPSPSPASRRALASRSTRGSMPPPRSSSAQSASCARPASCAQSESASARSSSPASMAGPKPTSSARSARLSRSR